MIIIINGSVGAGKLSVSWELLEKFDKSIMLDGDYIGAVYPFEIYDNSRIEYLYDTLYHFVKFHNSNGYNNFVINYVFESSNVLKSLTKRLEFIIPEIHCFWITCSNEEQKDRISRRNTRQLDWELKRFIELNNIQTKASLDGFIGEKIETDEKGVNEIAEIIWSRVQSAKP
jgi:chloramphenicol 3-O-phosphotransferase